MRVQKNINIMEIFAQNLSFLMKENKINQIELSKQLDCSFSAVSKWLKCQREPSITNVYKIADFFGCAIDDLLK